MLPSTVLIFDIETIPDCDLGRKLFELHDLQDTEVCDALITQRRQSHGSDFLPHYFQQIVAISAVLRSNDHLKVWSLGEPISTEKELIERFFHGLEKYTPMLVSWNGGGFDLPVLHYRTLAHGVSAPRYWEMGENDQNFKWNNYLNRFHFRHLDLMDVLSGYQSRAVAPLDHIATLLNLPGKMGKSGSSVMQQFHDGDIEAIRNYCETDVLNTYLIYLRFEWMRGNISIAQYQEEQHRLRRYLQEENKTHFNEFLQNWP